MEASEPELDAIAKHLCGGEIMDGLSSTTPELAVGQDSSRAEVPLIDNAEGPISGALEGQGMETSIVPANVVVVIDSPQGTILPP